MTARTPSVSSLDVELLGEVGSTGSVVRAARALGISRDRAVYHLARMSRAFGAPVVAAARGGPAHGQTLLTPLGDRIAHGGFDVLEPPRRPRPAGAANVLRGQYRRGPPPTVDVGRGLRLVVAFPAEDGAPVRVVLDPEAIVVARGVFASSARNVVRGIVRAVRPSAEPLGRTLVVHVGATSIAVSIAAETVRALGLAPGRAVYLYVKATALRRVGAPSHGSPRS